MTESCGVSDEKLRAQYAIRDATVAWCQRQAERAEMRQDPAGCALWIAIAWYLRGTYGHSHWSDPVDQARLYRVGNRLPSVRNIARTASASAKKTWFHVFSKTYPVGGHTAYARRWLANDRFNDRHHVVLTQQSDGDCDPRLSTLVRSKGGTIVSVGNGDPRNLLRSAQKLREISHEGADVVVLHHHPWDVVPGIAFSQPGGPPVLVLNHADHVPWIGASVTDVVVNLRSNTEIDCARHRGVRTQAMLPIPLDAPRRNHGRVNAASSVRRELGIPDDAFVFLTVGTAQKYAPMEGLDFGWAAREITRASNSYVVAVGPDPGEAFWSSAFAASNGRVIAAGSRIDVEAFHAAANGYLEGFPFGSSTAFLEACLSGLSAIPAPLAVPAIFRCGSPALLAEPSCSTPEELVACALELVQGSSLRETLAERQSASIASAHCEPGWNDSLATLRGQLPVAHEVARPMEVASVPAHVEDFWSSFAFRDHSLFSRAFRMAFNFGLAPTMDRTLYKALAAVPRGPALPRHPVKHLIASLLLNTAPRSVGLRLLGEADRDIRLSS